MGDSRDVRVVVNQCQVSHRRRLVTSIHNSSTNTSLTLLSQITNPQNPRLITSFYGPSVVV